jgi:hypothetical protein
VKSRRPTCVRLIREQDELGSAPEFYPDNSQNEPALLVLSAFRRT